MSLIDQTEQPRIIKLLLGEATVVFVIVLNALAVFLDAFPWIHASTNNLLNLVDYACLLYFILEAILKIWRLSFRHYWQSGWNRFDLIIVTLSLPLLLSPFVGNLGNFSILLLLRMGRFLRFIRVMRFVPNAAHIVQGVVRALKASISVFVVLFVLNLILALGATMLFGDLTDSAGNSIPVVKKYFGDPLVSFYSLFKVFTVEGWYEIPDTLAASGVAPGWILLLRLYFIIAVLVGGILGLSLANAVFVDEMTLDNTAELEQMVSELRAELQMFRAEFHTLAQSQVEPIAEPKVDEPGN